MKRKESDMPSLLDEVSTYNQDLVLFRELGLKTFKFKNYEHKRKYHVGNFFNEKGFVKIEVSFYPAMFWKFQVYSNDSETLTFFNTGSGSLTDYWPFVEQILNGMIVIKEVIKQNDE